LIIETLKYGFPYFVHFDTGRQWSSIVDGWWLVCMAIFVMVPLWTHIYMFFYGLNIYLWLYPSIYTNVMSFYSGGFVTMPLKPWIIDQLGIYIFIFNTDKSIILLLLFKYLFLVWNDFYFKLLLKTKISFCKS
jgi:hypothetical protein